ncbi:MAG: hypothetical protein OXG91_05005 [bacterium]|nr:hypothetical protein [bacterium]
MVFAEALADARVIVAENVVDYWPLASAALRAGRTSPTLMFTSNRTYPTAT